MKKKLIFLPLALLFLACSTSRKPVVITTKKEAQQKNVYQPKTNSPKVTTPETTPSEPAFSQAEAIINTALSYKGTPYKYSGTTRSGMDCSGLVYTAFTKNDITLERSSYLMATQGRKIKLSEVRPGDLLFFVTNKNKNRINHVGLVVEIKDNDIRFIHATTSRGVLISSIQETYWDNAFVEARNIL